MSYLKARLGAVALRVLFLLALPFLKRVSDRRYSLRKARDLLDGIGVEVLQQHYYEPIYGKDHLTRPGDEPRFLPGLDLNLDGQRAEIARLDFAGSLDTLEGRQVGDRPFRFGNGMFDAGDAEALYSFVRRYRPGTIVEIGSGHSTLVCRLAIEDIHTEDPAYSPRHVCFEPFENAWLETTGAEIRRERIELADLGIFAGLAPGDIVFVDSSHVLKAQGDVECEFLRILPMLPVGVIVHVHDIFTPCDYPDAWLRNDRRYWTEQYLLEAFLSHNRDFEVMLALNHMHRIREPDLYRAFPVLSRRRESHPGSFWIRRIG